MHMYEPYQNYTTPALKAECQHIKNLRNQISEMQKPDNLTYVDIANLCQYLTTLEQIIALEIKHRS